MNNEVNTVDNQITDLFGKNEFKFIPDPKSTTRARKIRDSIIDLKEVNFNAYRTVLDANLHALKKDLERLKAQGKITSKDYQDEIKSIEECEIRKGLTPNRSVFHLFDEGKKALEWYYGDKLEIIAPYEGETGGVMFGFKSKVFSHLAKFGLNCDRSRYIPVKDFTKLISEVINFMAPDTGKFWLTLFTQGYKSELSKILKHIRIEQEKSTSLLGKDDAWKVIPALEDFDDRIRQIDPYELLATFPEAEADTTLLHLGRIAAGVPHSPTQVMETGSGGARTIEKMVDIKGEKIDFKFHYRTLLVHHGDAQVGKSTLWDKLLPAFNTAGYIYKPMPVSYNNFNWNAATADIMFAGDLSREGLLKLQKTDLLKSIVASETFPNEMKGAEIRLARARAAVVLICNEISELKGGNTDRGIKDRFHFCQAKSARKLEVEYGVNNLYLHWHNLEMKYDTSSEVLSLYLIRLALDKFLNAVGYRVIDNNTFEHNLLNDSLSKQMFVNKENYVYQEEENLVKSICVMSEKASIIARYFDEVPEEYDKDFQTYHLYLFANTITNLKNKINECKKDSKLESRIPFYKDLVSWLNPKCFNSTFWNRYYQQLDKNISNNAAKPHTEFWSAAIKSIETSSGSKPTEDRNHYKTTFHSTRHESVGFVKELEALLLKHNETVDSLSSIAVKFTPLE